MDRHAKGSDDLPLSIYLSSTIVTSFRIHFVLATYNMVEYSSLKKERYLRELSNT